MICKRLPTESFLKITVSCYIIQILYSIKNVIYIAVTKTPVTCGETPPESLAHRVPVAVTSLGWEWREGHHVLKHKVIRILCAWTQHGPVVKLVGSGTNQVQARIPPRLAAQFV